MSLDLCEMSLQQIKQLLSLTDTTIQNICCKRFTGDELYAEALQQVLGGRGRRGPAGISIVFREEDGAFCRGKMLHLVGGTIVERAEITIDPGSAYAASLLHAGTQADVLVSNWADSYEALEVFQSNFPDEIRAFIAEPIKNFVTCRISGDRPGAIIALNYPGRATDYDADILRSLAVVIGSLVTLSDEVRETEKAFIYTINALARACEAAEEETGKHIQRVNRYAGALAANVGVPAGSGRCHFILGADARRGEDQGPLYHPAEDGGSERGRAGADEAASSLRQGDHRHCPATVGRPGDRHCPSRELGRHGLSLWAQRGGDSPAGTYREDCRCVRCYPLQKELQGAAGPCGSGPYLSGRGRQDRPARPFRSGAAGDLFQDRPYLRKDL